MSYAKIDKDLVNLALFAELTDMVSTLKLSNAELDYKDAVFNAEQEKWAKEFELKEQLRVDSNKQFEDRMELEEQESKRWQEELTFQAKLDNVNQFFSEQGLGKNVEMKLDENDAIDIDANFRTMSSVKKGARLGHSFSGNQIIDQKLYTKDGEWTGIDITDYFSENDVLAAEHYVRRLLSQDSLTQNDINQLEDLGFFTDGGEGANPDDLNQVKANSIDFWNQGRRENLEMMWEGFKSSATDPNNRNYWSAKERTAQITDMQTHISNAKDAYFNSSAGKIEMGEKQVLLERLQLPVVEGLSVAVGNFRKDPKKEDTIDIDYADGDGIADIRKILAKSGLGSNETIAYLGAKVSGIDAGFTDIWSTHMDENGRVIKDTPLDKLGKQLSVLGTNWSNEFDNIKALLKRNNSINRGAESFVEFVDKAGGFGAMPEVTNQRDGLLTILDNFTIKSDEGGEYKGSDITIRQAIVAGNENEYNKAIQSYAFYSKDIPAHVAQLYLQQMLEYRNVYLTFD